MPQSPPIYGGLALIQIQSNSTNSSAGERCSSPLFNVDQDLLGVAPEWITTLSWRLKLTSFHKQLQTILNLLKMFLQIESTRWKHLEDKITRNHSLLWRVGFCTTDVRPLSSRRFYVTLSFAASLHTGVTFIWLVNRCPFYHDRAWPPYKFIQ